MKKSILADVINAIEVEWSIPDDFLQYRHFVRVVLNRIDWNSSPGFPLNRRYPNNGGLFGVNGRGMPSIERLQDVWEMVQQRLSGGEPDPIYLFIKPEPHKISKLNRKRLISSVSVVDAIIDHMLFDEFNDAVVLASCFGPIKAGWTPFKGGWKIFPSEGVSIDKTAWDWTMALWQCYLCLEIRKKTCLNLSEQWVSLAERRYRQLFIDYTFVLPSGTEVKLNKSGVMKSGSVVTLVDNSLAQLIMHYRVAISMGIDPGWIWAMGDDTRQSTPPNLKEYLDRLGQFCVVKECTESPEFAGFRFLPMGRIEPLYKGKHAFNLLYANPSIQKDLASAYSLTYHKSKDRDAIRGIVSTWGTPPLDDALDLVWDGE